MMNHSAHGITRVFSRWAAVLAAIIVVGAGPALAADPSTKLRTGKPLKVVILAGQSNMQKPASWHTLKGLADSPETKALYDKLVDESGKIRAHENVYEAVFDTKRAGQTRKLRKVRIPLPPKGYPLPAKCAGKVLGSETKERGEFGPELGFGVTLHEELQEPILIIKTAWGGKSLHTDFHPPVMEDWVPPKGHPEHPDSKPELLPIPKTFQLPKDFKAPSGRGKNMQVAQGRPIGEINGIHPIYITAGYGPNRQKCVSSPFKAGDVILGINGGGLREDPVTIWRYTLFIKSNQTGMKFTVTRWRPSTEPGGKGTIETVTIDRTKSLDEGSEGAEEFLKERKEALAKKKAELGKEGGVYYQKMMARIKEVLADPGKFHPAYDPKQGYEIVGFVWFQGYNDIIAGTVYPNRSHLRGYEKYSWLLAHLIRSVRKELNVPKLPVVIGVFGQGGKSNTPIPFREAMAAPASYDEFKGTVAAVRTAPFWDTRIDDYQRAASQDKQTPEGAEYLKNNVSNKGFHYNGSPKFFVRSGEAFAKALAEMIK